MFQSCLLLVCLCVFFSIFGLLLQFQPKNLSCIFFSCRNCCYFCVCLFYLVLFIWTAAIQIECVVYLWTLIYQWIEMKWVICRYTNENKLKINHTSHWFNVRISNWQWPRKQNKKWSPWYVLIGFTVWLSRTLSTAIKLNWWDLFKWIPIAMLCNVQQIRNAVSTNKIHFTPQCIVNID